MTADGTGMPCALVGHGGRVALWSPQEGSVWVGGLDEAVGEVRTREGRDSPRWTWWAAGRDAAPLVRAGLHLRRSWDVAEAHRLQHGGWVATPGVAWAGARGLPVESIPQAPADDLFAALAPVEEQAPGSVVLSSGHLRPDVVAGTGPLDDATLIGWARAAYDCSIAQREGLDDRQLATVASESAAALLCVELERDGLPVDRPRAEELIAASAGPRAADEAEARRIRAERDAVVLRHAPGAPPTDLRNPAAVRALLASVGVAVPTTRKHVLEPYRATSPLVDALLRWRADERVATTYGYGWLDAHVGPDDRLRGAWTACDGAAGRMTAQNGLHNLPVALRSAVAAGPGHVLVRADLGQIEPRVLAAVSGDAAFAAATRADDLYAPVAARLGVERPVAKVAVLAAMYGQRSGAAGRALTGLEEAYPVAMAHLDTAYAAGTRGEPVRTFGGRLVRTAFAADEHPVGSSPALDAARGRFARNAVIQGSAAELFKAWAATVRAALAGSPAHIVLCLHDELLVHAPAAHADEVARVVDRSLEDAARRWTGSARVRFVADTSVLHRWSEAKG